MLDTPTYVHRRLLTTPLTIRHTRALAKRPLHDAKDSCIRAPLVAHAEGSHTCTPTGPISRSWTWTALSTSAEILWLTLLAHTLAQIQTAHLQVARSVNRLRACASSCLCALAFLKCASPSTSPFYSGRLPPSSRARTLIELSVSIHACTPAHIDIYNI